MSPRKSSAPTKKRSSGTRTASARKSATASHKAHKPSAAAKRRPAKRRKPRRADTVMNTFVFAIAVFLALCAINLIGLTEYVEQPKSADVTYQVGEPSSFFNALGPIAEKYDDTGLYPSVMLAQAALESNFGESQLSFDYNNYFGIKAHGHHRSVKLATTEYYDGTETTIRDYFCVYSSPADCFEDYAELIVSNENYADAVGAKSPAVAARALQEGGYATDPYYASKVISVINEYNLTRFDPMETPGSQKSDAASSETTPEEGEGK